MPDTPGQGINVGDAVLTFLGDTTQLDAAFDRVATEAEVKMAKAADSVGQIGDALDGVGPSATSAGEHISRGMERARSSTYEAKGEAALLGEMFGIHLPRHVRTFVAELPGIGTALSAAFSATAILFLIEALAQGAEKLSEWMEHAHKLAMAWDTFDTAVAESFRGLDDKLLEAGIKLDDLKGNHVDALRKQLELIDHVSLKELEQQFGLLAKAADALFAELRASWYQFDAGSKGAQHALKEFKAQYDLLLAEGKDKEASDLLAGTLKSAQETLATLKEAHKIAEEPVSGPTGFEQPAGPGEKQIAAQDALVRALNAQVDAQKKIAELTQDEGTIKRMEEGKRAAEEEAAAEKRALDEQLAKIETWKTAQHAAYASGEIHAAAWRVAELQATDAAAVAHESYLQKLVALYTRAGQTLKAHTAAEELSTLEAKNAAKATDELATAMNKHREATFRVREEYARLVDAGVTKDFEATAKAAEKLAAAEDELTKAQSKLAEVRISQFYKDQEDAITKLAQMHLITEQQKDDRLKLLEEKQSSVAIAILNNQLREEEARVAEAAKKIAAMKLSPSVSNAQILEAEANLKHLEVAVTNTEAEIVATKEKFNKQSEANDKSHYGRALLMAMAAGNELLAEQLKQNHALLLAAQANLADAKARGLDTTAIHQQIAALKQNEQALQKEANGGKSLTAEKQKFVHDALLVAQAELAEAKARGLNTTAIEKEIIELQKLEKLQQLAPAQMKRTQSAMDGLRMATAHLKDELKAEEQQMSQAFASAMLGAIESGKSIGAAMEQATAAILKNLATQALAQALYNTALGIACAVTPGEQAQAAGYFAAAAEFGLVAALAGAAGMAMSPGGSGGGSSAGAPVPGQVGGNVNLGGGGGGTTGVTHLAAGGVVTRRIMIGDSESGGDAEEAILPLSDSGAMAKIVNAIIPVLPQNAPGFGFAVPAQKPPKGFDRSQPSESDRPDIHSGNPNDGDFERSEASIPRDMQGLAALAASFGGLLSGSTRRIAAGSRGADIAAATASTPTGFDANSMEKFADRIGRQVSRHAEAAPQGGGDIHINMPNVKGVVSPETFKKVTKHLNRMVQNRQITLNATNSLRVTRRSQ